ncbi:hypothetical protein BH18ACI4_BH18ACI4_27260 [soil metagenome]
MTMSKSWFQREAVWMIVFSFAPLFIALLVLVFVMLVRYLTA